TTVLGDRGVEVHEIFVDADSREHDTVAYASSQNVYRIGVGKDAKNRAALRAELKSRRTLLASIVAAGPRTKRYVPGSGTVKKVPVECGAIPGQVSVIAIKGEEKFEAGGKFSFDVPCTPGAASDVNRYAKDVRSDYENEAARAAAAKALAGDPDGAWSVFWLGQGPRPDDEIGKLLDGSPLCTKETKR
ncbi:MAG TPA: hypothetical protein VMV18_12240, partial [bacterium]|nr:hypothetical protein [bacterium]